MRGPASFCCDLTRAPAQCHIGPVSRLLPLLFVATVAGAEELPRKARHEIALSGTSHRLTVDDTSGWPAETLRWLVNTANASTRDDCPTSGGGLMAPGDRVFVSTHYLAWFDYTKEDGSPFPTAFRSDYARSGALAGLWALDPDTGWFRHVQRGPSGCTEWARNELIPGSASVRTDAEHWWDKYGPPVEHSLLVDVDQPGIAPCARGDELCGLVSHHLAANNPASGWQSVTDGVQDAAGVRYRTRGRMALFRAPWSVDITDRDDSNGIANAIESEVEYVCRDRDVVVTWRFRATGAPVTLRHAYTWVWTAYSKDQDLSPNCDQAAGSEWPGSEDMPFPFFRLPVFVQSSLQLHTGGRPPRQTVQPRQVFRMALGACPRAFPYSNPDVYTSSYAVNDGSWMRWSEGATPLTRGRSLQYTHLGVPGSGSGASDDPVKVRWKEMVFADETYDGVLGGGVSLADAWSLAAGRWYSSTFALSNHSLPGERPDPECRGRDCGR
jgi:hypothetical protein